MEAHECIAELVIVIELALDALFIHILGNGVVDVEQGNDIVRYAGTDELGQAAVDINFAAYGDTAAGQTAVDIAGNETELCLECGPALGNTAFLNFRKR